MPAERDWEGKTRFISTLDSTVLVFMTIVGTKDSFVRSSWGLEVDHEQYPGPWNITEAPSRHISATLSRVEGTVVSWMTGASEGAIVTRTLASALLDVESYTNSVNTEVVLDVDIMVAGADMRAVARVTVVAFTVTPHSTL